MKFQVALIAAAAALVAATPAAANEGRAEVRGGIAWGGGVEEAVAGAAVGYDFDLGESAFIGVEGSADHVLASGYEFVFGASARLGARVGTAGKIFAAGGYSFGEGEDQVHVGGGYEHKVGSNVYVKAEYRHFFSDFVDANVVAAGVGVTF